MSDSPISLRRGLRAISPIFVVIGLFLGLSLAWGDFYKVPLIIVFVAAAAYALLITQRPSTSPSTASSAPSPRLTIAERVGIFSRGAGEKNLMMMLWIFILAGAFAETAQQMGAIKATVNLTLTLLPASMLLPGLFLAACFVSLSIGTSVGTIVALVPVATGLASPSGIALPLLVASVVGGAFFGDNLSFISDTTIVATRSQGVKLSAKFRANFQIALPAALVGLSCGSFDVAAWFGAMAKGVSNMTATILVALLAGGLLEVIRYNGGIDFIIQRLTRHVRGKRGAEAAISALVSLINCVTANNTVAILSVGKISNDIADQYGVNKCKSASLLDTFSCVVQGLLPYGAQMLIAAGLAEISPIEILPYLYYNMVLGIIATAGILLRFPRKYS